MNKFLLKAKPVRYVSIQEEVDNMIKHKEKAIDKLGKRKYNRLLNKLKENL
jgi:hypothetical protein